MRNERKNTAIPINPLSLGIAYFGFSVLLLGLEDKSPASTVLGWITFGISAVLFVAVFWKGLARALSEKGQVTLVFTASIHAMAGMIIGLVAFLSGQSGWIVMAFAIFLLLWLFVLAGAYAGAAKYKKLIVVVSLGIVMASILRFADSDCVQGLILLALGVFVFLVARGTITVPKPPAP